MFEASLKEKLLNIFDLDKATFNSPGESEEQECIFIQVEKATNKIKDALQISRVTGKVRVFANADKLPYGYFHKKIAEAESADTKDLFFFDIEENAGTFQNICERSMSFVFFYSSQYNPEVGTMTDINFEVAE